MISRVLFCGDRIELRFENPGLGRMLFGCWFSVLFLACAGLVACVYNLSQVASWWSLLSAIVLAPLVLLLSLVPGIERRPSRVFAGLLTVLGGVEVVSCDDTKGVRRLQAAVRLTWLPVRWTWFSAPLGGVRVEAVSVQGGGFEARLLDGTSRTWDSVGDHLSDREVQEVVRAIDAWRGHESS